LALTHTHDHNRARRGIFWKLALNRIPDPNRSLLYTLTVDRFIL